MNVSYCFFTSRKIVGEFYKRAACSKYLKKKSSNKVINSSSNNLTSHKITSDLFNLPVFKSETNENSTLGCAACQFLALGTYKNLEEVKKNMVRYDKVFTPNKEAVKVYEELYKKVYLQIYPGLERPYKSLSHIKERNNKETKKE